MMRVMNRVRDCSEPKAGQMRVESESRPDQVRVESESVLIHPAKVLAPSSPPGRRNRKGRAFEDQIARLRAEGYTLEAIRDALAAVGVHVSKSTVQREAAREAKRSQAPGVAAPSAKHVIASATPSLLPTAPSPATPVTPPTPADRRSGKDIAEAFVRSRVTNPLISPRS